MDNKHIKQNWIETAKRLLIQSSYKSISIRNLSKQLGVTTGAFYWYFKNLDELEQGILLDWVETNTTSLTKAIADAGDDPLSQYFAYSRTIILEEKYDPSYDQAIRAWATKSIKVKQTLQKVDQDRINLLHQIFIALGFGEHNALIRARARYFHQIGYHSLGIKESMETRLRNFAHYTELFLDSDVLIDKGADEIYEILVSRALDIDSL